MNFNNKQIEIIENLINDRIFYLRENIGYCQNYLPDCRTSHELEENEKAILNSKKELKQIIELKSYILTNLQTISK
tara:strand:- start:288 stop:515 length:228 start_codon:yes stop_codon:yes gene_type:complete